MFGINSFTFVYPKLCFLRHPFPSLFKEAEEIIYTSEHAILIDHMKKQTAQLTESFYNDLIWKRKSNAMHLEQDLGLHWSTEQ